MKKILKDKLLLGIIISIVVLLVAAIVTTIYIFNSNQQKVDENNTNEQVNNENVNEDNNENIFEEENEYTIIFDSNGGSKVDNAIVKVGESVSKPEDPTRDGYTFVEWTLNDETYDFKKVVDTNITLKAVWKKKSTSTSSSSTTNNSQSTNKKAASTIDKINLNENISVIEYSTIRNCVYNYIFISNFEEVFPNIKATKFSIDNPDGQSEVIISSEEWEENFSKLKIDTAKEAAALKALENIKNTPYKGVAEFAYDNYNHFIGYSYLKLLPSDRKYYKDIYDALNKLQSEFYGKVSGALSGSYEVCVGGAGADDAGVLLTEELCNKYHLNCTRW